MKVLHIISSYNGGIYSFIRSKYKYIQNENVKFDIIALEKPPDTAILEANKYEIQLNHFPNPKKEGLRKFYNQLKRVFTGVQYDAIHCHLNGYRSLPFYIASKIKKTPFIIHAHNSGETEEKERSLFKKVFLFMNQRLNWYISDYQVSCSDKATNYIFGEKINKLETVFKLPNSIDEKKYQVEQNKEFRKELNIPSDKVVVGQVGRLDPNKNHIFTISLANEMKNYRNDYYWILIGEGREREKLERIIKNFNLEKTVKLLGRRENISKFYQVMDVLVYPSKNEGFGIVAIESQASGVYSLLSDTITREVDLEVGLVKYLPLDNKHMWIENLFKIPDKPNLSKKLLVESLNKKKLTNEQAAKEYIRFLKTVISDTI